MTTEYLASLAVIIVLGIAPFCVAVVIERRLERRTFPPLPERSADSASISGLSAAARRSLTGVRTERHFRAVGW